MHDPSFPGLRERLGRLETARPRKERAAGPYPAPPTTDLAEYCWLHCLETINTGRAACLRDILNFLESAVIRLILIQTGGNQNQACRILAVKPSTLSYKIRRLGLHT